MLQCKHELATQAQLTYYNLQNEALPKSILLVRDEIIEDVHYYLTYACQRVVPVLK